MKKKFKNILLLLLTAMLAVFTLAGCASYRKTKEELISSNGYTASVCYYANGGKINEDPVRELYYKAGSKALEIGAVKPTSGKLTLTRMNYEFGGWYFVDLNGKGEPIFLDEEKTMPKLTDEKADFSVPLKDGDKWIVGAKWIANTKVYVQLICDEGETLNVKQKVGKETLDKSYTNGDTVLTIDYDNGKAIPPSPLFTVTDATHTFLSYYSDAECTQVAQDADWKQQESDVTLYAKYITGNWTIVKTTSELRKMFNDTSDGKRYWLFNDIDASSLTVNAVAYSVAPLGLDCEIRGNGYTISNLKVTKSEIANDYTVSMFGAIGKNAKISDLTFENVKASYTAYGANVSLYFIFSDMADGAQISNVNISGKLEISKPASTQIDNMTEEKGFSNCLYGNAENENYTDADYVAASGGTGFIVAGNPQDFITVN